MTNQEVGNPNVQIILDRLNDMYCAQENPSIVDWKSTINKEIEQLWGLRKTKDISSTQLIDIAWFLNELFNDSLRAKELISEAATINAYKSLELYKKTVSYLSDVEETKNALISLFVEEGNRRVAIECEERPSERSGDALYDFFNLAMRYDYSGFQNRLKNLMINYFDEGWHNCDVLGKIVAWFGRFWRDERYIVSLEKLLKARIEALGYEATEDLTVHAWDNDEKWYYDLGTWYIEKGDTENCKKGMHYLINGRGGEANLIGLELFVNWTKALYKGGVKSNHKSTQFWTDLAIDMENINERKGSFLFSENDISECRSRATLFAE